MSRTTSASSTTTTATTTSGHVRTVSVKANNAKPQQLNPMPASDIRLFVTNLRLLDFDLRDDWPDITVQTFSAKNADQRQRIAGTEWALFRLFEIWDPSETAQKLQPFFPPLEPLQSLNLRAALFRCLNELKKNGVLGRESVLRKTMLDECKGDKFYEIIAIFSNVTLKKVLAARDGGGRDEAVARRLATAPILPIDQQQSLLPLAIAHRAALVNVLKKKEEKRRKYMEFEAMLDKKAEDINRRIRKCKDIPRAQKPAVSQKEADAVKRQLKDNWIGNQKWLNVMLHGEETHAGDAFLNSRFDKVWYMVEKGRKLEDVAPETGLLENLQSRVQEQQERLQKWKDFHEELQNDASGRENRVNLKRVAPIKELKFDAHSQYQLPPSKQTVEQTAIKRPAMRVEYRDILSDMDVELEHAGKIRAGPVSTILPRRRTSPAKEVQSPIPKRKPTLPEPVPASPTSPVVPPKPKHLARPNSLQKVPTLPKPSHHMAAASTPIDSEATLVGQASALLSSPPAARHAGSPIRKSPPPTPPRKKGTPKAKSPEATVTLTVQQASPSPNERASNPLSDYPSEPPVPTFEPPVLDPDEAMADQIIDSIGNATPSPVKKPQPRMSLSLLERTRLTMSRTNSSENTLESPLPLPSMAPPPLPANHANPAADLLERTRLSMVASQSVPRPKPSKPQRKPSGGRQSLYPVNQFDTPPRNRQSSAEMLRQGSVEPVDVGDESPGLERTPTEQLFSDEVDYDRVFKSRPLIATSPVWSPGGGEDDDDDPDGVTGIDLRDVDQDDDEDGEEGGYGGSWMDSPSHKRRVRC